MYESKAGCVTWNNSSSSSSKNLQEKTTWIAVLISIFSLIAYISWIILSWTISSSEISLYPFETYFGQVLLLTAILTFFLYSFYYTSSLSLKGLSITAYFVGIITFITMKSSLFPYDPFSCLNICNILTDKTEALVFSPSINLSTAVMLTFSLGYTLLFAGYKLFIKTYHK